MIEFFGIETSGGKPPFLTCEVVSICCFWLNEIVLNLLKQNMIHRMNLFITKGARPSVRSRKAGWYEEISSGSGAREASPLSASSADAQLAQRRCQLRL